MKFIMKKAWAIARRGQRNFGGKVSEYFAQALKMAWAIAKKTRNATLNELAFGMKGQFRRIGNQFDVNTWEKGGHRRLYISENKKTIGMIALNENNNVIKKEIGEGKSIQHKLIELFVQELGEIA